MPSRDARSPATGPEDLEGRCERLRSLHRPGAPLVLANAWDAATATAVVAAGFPVVATTSGGVAASLGYEDHEGAPGEEMLAAAARIVDAVDAPVTVDAEAGYGMGPVELVAALERIGAAGCNLEDTDHRAGELRDVDRHAGWLAEVRRAAAVVGYPLVINARIDVFLAALLSGGELGAQAALVDEAVARAGAYFDAGVDCVYPIALAQAEALGSFVSRAGGPVNALAFDPAPSLGELAALGVARISYGTLMHRDAIERFSEQLSSLQAEASSAVP